MPLCHHDGPLWFQDPEGWPVLQGTMVGEVGNGEMQVPVGLRTGAFALSIPGTGVESSPGQASVMISVKAKTTGQIG